MLEEIPLVGCERHLTQENLGRIVVVVGDHPEVFPVNYVYETGAVLFRTDPGTKLDAVREHDNVAFEIDGIDDEHQGGWSVLVVGSARKVTDQDVLARVAELPLEPWVAGEKHDVVRLVPSKITGRRIRHATH